MRVLNTVMRKLVICVFFLVLAFPVYGQTLDAKFYVVDDAVVVKEIYQFDEPFFGNLSLHLPSDAETIEIYVDDQKISAQDILQLQGEQNVQISYITKEYIDKTSFIGSFSPFISLDSYKISVVLPEEAVLEKSIQENDPLSGSFFPKGAEITSDGRSLIFVWDYEHISAEDQFSYYIRYQEKTNYVPYFVVLLILIATGFFVTLKAKSVKAQPEVGKAPESRYGLKEEEESIVNILNQRDGKQIEQGTLRVITGYSKASLSRLLKELEERKIIYKEKRGKKNLIFLK